MYIYNTLIISYISNVADIRINIHLQTKLGAFIFINTKFSTMCIYKYKSFLLNMIYILNIDFMNLIKLYFAILYLETFPVHLK